MGPELVSNPRAPPQSQLMLVNACDLRVPGERGFEAGLPPGVSDAPSRVTRCPRLAATHAASSPATPVPTTTTWRAVAQGTGCHCASPASPRCGLWSSANGFPAWTSPQQKLLNTQGTDLVGSSVSGLGRECGIADLGPGHAHQLGVAAAHDALGEGGGADATKRHHRDPVGGIAHPSVQIDEVSRLEVHVRDVILEAVAEVALTVREVVDVTRGR